MDEKEIKEFQKKQEELITVLRETVETAEKKGKENDAVVQGTIEHLNKKLDGLEEKNQVLVTKQLEDEKIVIAREDELKGRIDEMEKKAARIGAGGEDNAALKAEIKAFETFVTKGDKGISPEEFKYLRTDVDTDGGYLAPLETSNDIIKRITEVSPVRGLVRVRTTSRRGIEIPKRTGIPTAYRVGQGVQDTQSQSSYGMETINVERVTVDIPISIEMLADAAFSMESEINMDAGDAFARTEGLEFISGTGVGEMQGILTNADVGETVSGLANAITADSLITISGTLKDGYIGRYLLNRTSMAIIRTLKDGTGQYLWQNGLAAGLPSTINGEQYVSAIDMPDIAAGNYPVAYGDFARAYTMVDHTSTTLLRDPYTLGREGKVLFIMHRRNGGKVVLAEAIKKLKISA
jgi:HK97 family phage major capsid protein